MRFRYLPPTDQWCSPLGERDAVSTYRPVALSRIGNKKGDRDEKDYER
jgi:hypothetical protein